jgi:hypothetical protein
VHSHKHNDAHVTHNETVTAAVHCAFTQTQRRKYNTQQNSYGGGSMQQSQHGGGGGGGGGGGRQQFDDTQSSWGGSQREEDFDYRSNDQGYQVSVCTTHTF